MSEAKFFVGIDLQTSRCIAVIDLLKMDLFRANGSASYLSCMIAVKGLVFAARLNRSDERKPTQAHGFLNKLVKVLVNSNSPVEIYSHQPGHKLVTHPIERKKKKNKSLANQTC